MPLFASTVTQLTSFSESFDFGPVLDALTDNVAFSNVIVTTFPSGSAELLISPSANIVLTNNTDGSNISFIISGFYGLDVASDDTYRVVTFENTTNVITTYNNFNTLENAVYDHLFDFRPQDWSYKQFVYFFEITSNGSPSIETVTQDVYPDTSRHAPRLTSVLAKEIV